MASSRPHRLTEIVRGENGEGPAFIGRPIRVFGFGEEAGMTEELVRCRNTDGRRYREPWLVLEDLLESEQEQEF